MEKYIAEKSVEAERRFIIKRESYNTLQKPYAPLKIEQVYLQKSGNWAIRSRKINQDGKIKYKITMKHEKSFGEDYEIELPGNKYGHEQILAHAGKCIHKTRNIIEISGGLIAEVDDFKPSGLDLIIAEVELPNINHGFEKPDWFGKEVTGQKAFSNAEIFRKLCAEDGS